MTSSPEVSIFSARLSLFRARYCYWPLCLSVRRLSPCYAHDPRL